MSAPRMHARVRALLVLLLVLLFSVVAAVVTAGPARAADIAPGAAWLRPVSGEVVHPFDAPASPYGPGHRGADLAAAPGTAVLAANDGVVSFAGSVAGTLHVTVAHPGDLRTSYSFLATVSVRAGQTVTRGDVVGTTGGTGADHAGADHAGAVLHLGLRIGERYVDPMQLFRPADLTKLVRLVPTDEPQETPWSPAIERRDLQSSLRLPVPGGDATPITDDDECDTGLPLIGDAVDLACDVGSWLGDHAEGAIDAGIGFLDATTDLAAGTLDALRASVRATVASMRAVAAASAIALARTPAGQLALDVVAIGRRFGETVLADCSDDAPAADGTGGSAHRVMVVAGINSEGKAWDRGPTVDLDVDALGYHRDDGEVRYYSYAANGGPYTADETHRPIVESAALLAEQLRRMQREQPGREVDLIGYSQGGVVIDAFLVHFYRPGDQSFPPLGNVVTLSSPHEGAPLATAGGKLRSSAAGRLVLDGLEGVASVPPSSSPSVHDLAEGSSTIVEIQDTGVPDHFDVVTIGATEDVVVPATNISLEGATETIAAVDAPNEHSAIVRAPAALRAVRAALEGRAPPCVGLVTALRGAVAPVVISRVERTLGDGAATLLGGVAP